MTPCTATSAQMHPGMGARSLGSGAHRHVHTQPTLAQASTWASAVSCTGTGACSGQRAYEMKSGKPNTATLPARLVTTSWRCVCATLMWQAGASSSMDRTISGTCKCMPTQGRFYGTYGAGVPGRGNVWLQMHPTDLPVSICGCGDAFTREHVTTCTCVVSTGNRSCTRSRCCELHEQRLCLNLCICCSTRATAY